jgi:hypothetical protein
MTAEDDLSEIAAAFGINRADESTFDSADFPKILTRDRAADVACHQCGRALDPQP